MNQAYSLTTATSTFATPLLTFLLTARRDGNNENRIGGLAVIIHTFGMLPDEQASLEQIAVLRAMPGSRRLELAERLYWSARKMKEIGVRSQHPDWPETRVQEEVRQIFINGRT